LIALSFVMPSQISAQRGRAQAASSQAQVQPTPLDKSDLDQLRAAAKIPGSRALVVARVDRVQRIQVSADPDDISLRLHLPSDAGPVVVRATPLETQRIRERFGTLDLAGKTIRIVTPYIYIAGDVIEISVSTSQSEGGPDNFGIVAAAATSVSVRHPAASGLADCEGTGNDRYARIMAETCIAAERRAAAAGDASAMGRLGWRYLERAKGGFHQEARYPASGTGVTQNNVEAVRWLRAAAQAGDPRAMANLGFLYTQGLGGLVRNDAEAARWFQRGADAGDRRAMTGLGVMYQAGRGGLKRDPVSAVRWFQAAAIDNDPLSNQGDTRAMMHLALMYLTGRGIAQSDAEAIRWLRRAAAGDGGVAGDATALFELGIVYATGAAGVPKNLAAAHDAWSDRGRFDDALGAGLFELGNGTPDAVYAARDHYFEITENSMDAMARRWTKGQVIVGVVALVVILASLTEGSRPSSGASSLMRNDNRSPLCDMLGGMSLGELEAMAIGNAISSC